MWIGGAEGAGFRYEVRAIADGYLVLPRDLDTGDLDANDARLFRTAPVAFAHAQAMAAIDRFASTLLADGEAPSERRDAQVCEARLVALKSRLSDEGCTYRVDAEPLRATHVHH